MEDYQDIREHILIDRRHGGPYDRGSADSYYNRPRRPHYYKGDTPNCGDAQHCYRGEKATSHLRILLSCTISEPCSASSPGVSKTKSTFAVEG